MKKKIAIVAFYILFILFALAICMKTYHEVYNKGFHDGIKFTLDEIWRIANGN